MEVEKDENHEKALKIRDNIINGKFGKIIISDYIFDETVTTTFYKTKNLDKAVLVGQALMNVAEILKVEEETLEKSWKIFMEQKETKFSFTDCTILALMKENGIKNLATFDKDFKKIKEINIIE